MVTRNKEMRQHRVKTVLLEEKVTITVSAQEHERNQCRLGSTIVFQLGVLRPSPDSRSAPGISWRRFSGTSQQHVDDKTICP